MPARPRRGKRFLTARLYENPAIVDDRARSVEALDRFFEFLLDHPETMPGYFAEQARRLPRHRVVCDYIAGMTDSYLLKLYRERALGETPASLD